MLLAAAIAEILCKFLLPACHPSIMDLSRHVDRGFSAS